MNRFGLALVGAALLATTGYASAQFRRGGAGVAGHVGGIGAVGHPGGAGASFARPRLGGGSFARPSALAGGAAGFSRPAVGGASFAGGYHRGWRGRGFWPGYAVAAGLGLGYGLGYDYGYDYGYPYDYTYYGGDYDYAPAYTTVTTGAVGDYCATPVKTCQLYEPAQVGVGCSCRVPGGRAGGVVQ